MRCLHLPLIPGSSAGSFPACARLLIAMAAAGAVASCNRGDLAGGQNIAASREAGVPSDGELPRPGEIPVRINEVMVENTSTLEDEEGAFPPWIEIYNAGDTDLDLGGMPFSDDLLDTEKWRIPDVPAAVLPPGGFLVIFADGENRRRGSEIHAGFALSAGGRQLQLILNKGSDIVFLDPRKLGPDVSAGRAPDGAETFAVLLEPTPGSPNSDPAETIETEGRFIRGDANEDNRVHISDMSLMLRILFRSAPMPPCQDRVDTNDDGEFNVTDPTFLGNALFLYGAGIPPPFPDRGVDPTRDALSCPP